MEKKVLVTLSFSPELIQGFDSCIQLLENKGFEVIVDPRHRSLTKEELLPQLHGVYAHVASAEVLSEEVFASADSLKIISRMGIGYDAVDVKAATKHGIAVTITPGANADAVAEYTVALMLGLSRKIAEVNELTRKGVWKTVFGTSLYGKTLGILGLGNIGKRLARNVKGFDMKILACDPYRDEEFAAQHGINYCSFETLLRESDVLSIHAPLTDESRHLFSDREFAMMKPNVQLINCARGEIVDEKALYKALMNKKIAGAALDVYEQEPVSKDNPLFSLENVLLSPHTAGMTYEGRKKVIDMAFQNIIDLSEGIQPLGLINPEVMNEFQQGAWK